MPSVNLLKELDYVIDQMIETGDSAETIMDACQTALKENLNFRDKTMPESLRRLDFFRLP